MIVEARLRDRSRIEKAILTQDRLRDQKSGTVQKRSGNGVQGLGQ